MPIYTKTTTVVFQDQVDAFPADYLTAATAYLKQMVEQGKTDGVPEFLDMYTIKRVWLDQAAIDEWDAFRQPLDEQYSVVRLSRKVEDWLTTGPTLP